MRRVESAVERESERKSSEDAISSTPILSELNWLRFKHPLEK
jgi:hypothetical protein